MGSSRPMLGEWNVLYRKRGDHQMLLLLFSIEKRAHQKLYLKYIEWNITQHKKE